jgi:hypothetical protein
MLTTDKLHENDSYSYPKKYEHATHKATLGASNSIPSSGISVDPDKQLLYEDKQCFHALHKQYDSVFDPTIGKYNDASGKVRAFINMGPVEPPAQKGRLPMYQRKDLETLQDKMDELEELGVLAKPESVGVTVQYVSPSFLVKKPGGGSRLVTAFNNIGSYTKPLPTRVTSCDDVLRFLAQWKYILKTDMTKQFYQLPMRVSSMKYLGVVTPYKGIRVYTRAAMGMPGSTEHLDELMFRVLGDVLKEGVAMKLADDLYVGGNNIQSLLCNWQRVLHAMYTNNLKLSASKTVICPITTSVLGWIWNAGSISISPHKLNPLATCSKPSTVKALRSWLGAFKHMKPCISQCSTLLSPLESAIANKDSSEHIQWSDALDTAFQSAQSALNNPRTITIPRPSDQLIITSDGALRNGGIGSVLYVMRNDNMKLGGYFSAKLKTHQQKWLPCEIEALAISSAVAHWGPHILASEHLCQILSDSKPCIQAFEKLQRGEFSYSARITTFLSTLSRYQVSLHHIAGSKNLPADYLSRHPMECKHHDCQVCKFIDQSETAVVREISVSDVIDGSLSMPFTNRSSWKTSQQDCPSLRRTFAHLSQATRPSKKVTNIRDVKRYLQVATLGHDGLVVVKQSAPFTAQRELIIIPRHVLAGILTALHLRLSHPTKSQLCSVFHKYFYALDADKEIECITKGCCQCASLARLPKEVVTYSTSKPADIPGTSFACDVMCRARQKILVIRDCFSSFTKAAIIHDETAATLRDAIIELTADIKASTGATVRVDGATSMQCLANDRTMQSHNLTIEVGRLKNVNKNSVVDKAIQELEFELKRACPEGGPVTSASLACVISTLNRRIRNRGLSAREILFQRDNETGAQLNFEDTNLANKQHASRLDNHVPSAKSKAPRGKGATKAVVAPGDLVFVKNDGTKHTARDRYIVGSVEEEYVLIRKLLGSQYRNKQYKVKPCELYPVPYRYEPREVPNYVAHDRYESDSTSADSYRSDDSDDNYLPIPHIAEDPIVDPVDHPPDPDNDFVNPPAEHLNLPLGPVDHDQPSTGSSSSDSDTNDEDPNVVLANPRVRRRPNWMHSDEWVFKT